MKRIIIGVIAGMLVSVGIAGAATHYLITSTHQIKPSVLTQLKGNRGLRGKQGVVGPRGPQGEPGKVTVTTGSGGTQVIQGQQGPQGPQGAKGDKGATGATGDTGATGLPGQDGKDGQNGAPGAPGANGAPGISKWQLVKDVEAGGFAGVACPAGTHVLGGGFNTQGGASVTYYDQPFSNSNNDGWQVGTNGAVTTVWALCATVSVS